MLKLYWLQIYTINCFFLTKAEDIYNMHETFFLLLQKKKQIVLFTFNLLLLKDIAS